MVVTVEPARPSARLLLLRHGETEWSKTGRHTGRTDVPLTEKGRRNAARAAAVLRRLAPLDPLVIASPRRRARVTAELAGLHVEQTAELLAEWDYGDYEGRTTEQIRRSVPDWLVWTHGCPGGETVEQVSARADRAVALALEHLPARDVIFVGHSHFCRAIITRWLQLPLVDGTRFAMPVASVAVTGFEHGLRQLISLGLTG